MHRPAPRTVPPRAGAITVATGAAIIAVAPPAHARPYTITSHSVAGGGATAVTGGPYTLGVTIGQPAASGPASGGSYTLSSGFWSGLGAGCYADCDGSSTLTINDFICFQTRFALGNPYADCDGSGTLNVNDYICFQTKFSLGCPP